MRNKKAKQIRKTVSGDMALNQVSRKYYRHNKTGQIISDGNRRLYQQSKKILNKGK